MATENAPMDHYAAVLADLLAKRAEIDSTIRMLENLSGLKSANLASRHPISFDGDVAEDAGIMDAGLFLGMSIVDATKKLLAMRKRSMGNPEIARELKAGGLAMQSTDPVNTVGSVLTRRFNQVGDVVKISRGTWGLKEWYPNRTFKPVSKAKVSNPAEPEAEDDTVNVPLEDDFAAFASAAVSKGGPPFDDDLDDDVPF